MSQIPVLTISGLVFPVRAHLLVRIRKVPDFSRGTAFGGGLMWMWWNRGQGNICEREGPSSPPVQERDYTSGATLIAGVRGRFVRERQIGARAELKRRRF